MTNKRKFHAKMKSTPAVSLFENSLKLAGRVHVVPSIVK